MRTRMHASPKIGGLTAGLNYGTFAEGAIYIRLGGHHFGHRPTFYTVSQKRCHPNHGYNFVNSWSICKILSLLQRAVNFQQNPY